MYSHDLRWTACNLYYQRYHSVRKTADALMVGKSSVSRWLNDHPISQKIRRQCNRTTEIVQWMVKELQLNPFHSLSTLHRSLPGHLAVSRSTLARCVRRTGWTRKMTSKLQLRSKHQESLEASFLTHMKDLQGTDWISIDETCIWTDMMPTKGYAPVGQRLNLPLSAKNHRNSRKKLSLLVAISRSGQSFSLVKEGSIRSADFAQFIQRLPFPSGATLVMDNASIHKTRLVTDEITRRNYRVVYTAPYRPDWNPIEHLFSPFKHHFRSLYKFVGTIEEKLQKVWSMLPDTIYQNCYNAVEARYIAT